MESAEEGGFGVTEPKIGRLEVTVDGKTLWSEPIVAGLMYYQKAPNGPWQLNWMGMPTESVKALLRFIADHEAEICDGLNDIGHKELITY